MTICIAALCEDRNSVVLAADHMITAAIPPMEYQFEKREPVKIHQMGIGSFAMFSGDVVVGTSVIQETAAAVLNNGITNVAGIADIAKNTFTRNRLSTIEQQHLIPRGLNLEQYYANQHQLIPGLVHVLDNALMETKLGVDFILAGWNGSRYSIYAVGDPGVATCLDAIGYHAVGSGSPHAFYGFLVEEYSTSLSRGEAKEKVTKIKHMSEKAPGVGLQTTCLVLPLEEENDAATKEEGEVH